MFKLGTRTRPGRARRSHSGCLRRRSRSPFFAQVLAGLAREVDAGEHRVRGVLGGASATGKLDAGELILLQANVNRYSEVVDLSARLIDHAVNRLKTVLQGRSSYRAPSARAMFSIARACKRLPQDLDSPRDAAASSRVMSAK